MILTVDKLKQIAIEIVKIDTLTLCNFISFYFITRKKIQILIDTGKKWFRKISTSLKKKPDSSIIRHIKHFWIVISDGASMVDVLRADLWIRSIWLGYGILWLTFCRWFESLSASYRMYRHSHAFLAVRPFQVPVI